jgi:hypothetical protein
MWFLPPSPHRYRRISSSRTYRPRGIAVVMILGLLAITIAVSYATLRGQGTTTQLARNNSRSLDARAASRSGIAAALRKISENAWGGVSVTLQSNVTPTSWYVVTFTTGDAKLASTDPSYSEYPYRLMIDSVGYAADPLNTAVQSQYKSRCTVQLQRKQLVADPANWSTLIANNVYQYSNNDAYVQFPVKINGPTTLLGKLQFCTEYPGSSSVLDQYTGDLNLRRIAGKGDDRPFPTAMTIKGIVTTQDATTMTRLTAKLGMVLTEPLVSASPPSHPGAVTSYTLYPGGKTYSVPLLAGSLQNTTLAPDPLSNPLGIYHSSGSLTLQGNTNITGTIITDASSGSDIQVTGTGVVLKAFNLPSLYGSSQVYQLPAIIDYAPLRMASGSTVTINGAAMCYDQFEIKQGTQASTFALTGNLITNTLLLRGRSTWVLNSATWTTDKTLFTLQMAVGIPYFPDYEASGRGFTVKPALTFSSDSSGVKQHWHDWTKAVYQPDPADPGLRWEVVRWEENL